MTEPANLMSRVRQVLLADWDPIGIRDVPQARDEYDGYAATIVGMLAGGASLAELSDRLVEMEVDSMGLKGDSERARVVARKLWNLGRSSELDCSA